MNLFKILKYQLYLLQLENYELRRYWKLIRKRGFLPPETGLRKKLIWTNKATLIFAVAEGLIFGTAVYIAILLHRNVLENSVAVLIAFIGIITVLKMLAFIFFSLGVVLIWPMDYGLKIWLVARAANRVKDLPNLKIIGIAGSYGKTTMKEVLKQVLSIKYQVLNTEDSINTPVGIARWILKSVDETTQVIIVEMGEHYRGDIRELCKLTPPDVAVITGINEAHLERLQTRENVVATIFEIAQGSKEKGMLVLNGDDKQVMENYQRYIRPGQNMEKYQVSNIKHSAFDTQSLCWHLLVEVVGEVRLCLLGEYALGNMDCAVKIAAFLGMDRQDIKTGVEKIRPVNHRLEPTISPRGILVIDDAYNGNSDGVREAIKVLARFTDKRRVYLTPGLVETGNASQSVHLDIGRQLASVADVVILIRNSVTAYIADGINNELKVIEHSSHQKKPKPEIIWFNTALEAHAALPKVLKPNDVILFQNDWGDQYL